MQRGLIPTKDSLRVGWMENAAKSFPVIGATLGFTQEEIDFFVADCETVRFAILNARAAKSYAKASTKYKASILYGVINSGDAPTPSLMQKPAVLTSKGAFKRVQKIVRRMKEHPNYSQVIAAALQIGSSKSPAVPLDTAKPKGKAFCLINSVVRIDWTKGKFHGVRVESMRGDETEWQEIGFDMRSPFIDARPPLVAGKPEERRYRLRYFLDDEAVGLWSDIIVIITQP